MQRCKYPIKTMNITQSYTGTYSHSKNYNGQRKIAGYRAAHESRGIPVDEALLRFFPEDTINVQAACRQLVALQESGLRFDAVYTSEDMLGVGAVKYAHKQGLSIPGDLSVIGHNNSSYCLCSTPELTSVDNKLKAVSDQCVTTLLGLLEGKDMPQQTVFAPELIKRGSTL